MQCCVLIFTSDFRHFIIVLFFRLKTERHCTKMAPKFPDEVNVFLVPHSRMKDLVGSYMDQVTL